MESIADTLEARMEEILRDASSLERRPGSTITPGPKSADAHATRAIELLSRLSPGALELASTLGEGGMGIVHGARQLSLEREVAVKTLKKDQRTPSASLKLLREAWITGALEHPNVVPVYDVSLEADGSPRIVLKKIAGRSWAELMHDEKEVRRRFHASDLLEWNLRVLMQVAGAVHFAHGRGVLHRDLKPENVMIGEHGEIYVVDWGIAVALRDDGSGRLPLARDATEMAGTPCYMAPEMLGGRPGLLSPRTDVYLLGAILYEIVVGHAPHEGESLMEIVHRIARSQCELPEDTPAELARIVRIATDPEPHARFETAEQLRLALAGFLEHRASMQLADEALARLAELERERASESADPDEKRLRLYHLFGECRFGFLHALRAWRENVEARAGLRRSIEQMIEVELELGDPRAASLLLSELADPPAALSARVEEARGLFEVEEQKRARLAREHDPSVGRRTRVFVGVTMGTLWTLLPVAVMLTLGLTDTEPTHAQGLGLTAFLVGVGAAIALWARDSLSRTAINRRMVAVVASTLGCQALLFAGTWSMDISVEHTLVLLMLTYTLAALGVTIGVDTRLWPTALAFAIGFVVASLYPPAAMPSESLANFVLTVNIALIWGRIDEDVIDPMQKRQRERRERFRQFLERLPNHRLE